MSTPTFIPRAQMGVASTDTMAADQASWIPPANNTCTDSGSLISALIKVSIAKPQRMRLVRGPVCPPHSFPSKTKFRALLKKSLQEAGRRDVQIGRDAESFELPGLTRSSTRDDSEGRFDFTDGLHLLLAQAERQKSQDARAPRPLAHELFGLDQYFSSLRAGQDGKGDKWQGAGLGHRQRERRDVAYPGHRALHDGKAGLVQIRDRGAGAEAALIPGLA